MHFPKEFGNSFGPVRFLKAFVVILVYPKGSAFRIPFAFDHLSRFVVYFQLPDGHLEASIFANRTFAEIFGAYRYIYASDRLAELCF